MNLPSVFLPGRPREAGKRMRSWANATTRFRKQRFGEAVPSPAFRRGSLADGAVATDRESSATRAAAGIPFARKGGGEARVPRGIPGPPEAKRGMGLRDIGTELFGQNGHILERKAIPLLVFIF